jgi:hypothetical protein
MKAAKSLMRSLMPKNKGGRPTLMTENTIQKLEQAFSVGATDLEACFFANISKSTLYNYQESHPEFVERKEGLKNQLSLIAKNTLGRSIKNGNETDAKWYLERKNKDEFSTKTQSDNRFIDGEGNDRDLSVKVDYAPSKHNDT